MRGSLRALAPVQPSHADYPEDFLAFKRLSNHVVPA